MAFVCKTEKPAFLPSHDENPGPGYYPLPNSSKMGHGYAPFLSTAPKRPQSKKNGTKPPPGPGAYNLPSSFQAVDKTSKVSYSTLNRHQQPLLEYVNMTTTFKSKVKRFESLERESAPGPGAYEHQDQYKRRNSLSLAVTVTSNVIVDKIIEQNRKGVASIPSHMNRYGYSEDDKHNLIANKNPLFELQKYVGPGYYQASEHFGANKSKGIAWDRSHAKRFDDAEVKKATRTAVGPGTYELEIKAAPSYQNKPTSSFASKIARESLVEKKSSPKKRSVSVPTKRGNSLINEVASNDQSLMFADQFKEEMDDLIALQEIADIAPGPGHYYNDRINSSIRTSYRPPRLQFFGSSTERFPGREPIIPTAGPGEYHERNKSEPSKKSKKRAPFSTATKRFEKDIFETTPGPGAYDAKQMILDRIKDRERLGYIGSFGMTDKRFKEAPMPNNTQPRPESSLYHAKTEATPVDEKIDISTNQKPNQSFQSKVPRDPIYAKKDKIPPPGTYDLGYYDLSKRITKDGNNETRPPFNVASSRFKKAKIEERPINEEEESARSMAYPPEKKQRMNAVFVSQTKKNFEAMPVSNNVPGPGQYTKSVAGAWVKKTFNINFMQD